MEIYRRMLKGGEMLMSYALDERSRFILKAIVQNYIMNAEPVGSRTVSKMDGVEISPATIRNVMADLEEMGYVEQPHASAGRIPTDKGYRFYVDSLIKIPVLTKAESKRINRNYESKMTEIEKIMESTSKLLSYISNQAGIVLPPKFTNITFKHISFVKMRDNHVLAIFVSESGVVQNKIISIEEDIRQEDLDTITTYLNNEFGGLTLKMIREKIIEIMANDKREYDNLLLRAIDLGKKVFFEGRVKEDIYVGGATNILEQPEFIADVKKMKTIFKALEEKAKLIKILDKCIEEEGIHIVIGSESEIHEISDCSIVTHTYKYEDSALGVLGIFGPKRMEYPKVIAIVNYTAGLVSKILSGKNEES
ncbi:MAG: heat-inducible transcription repressor HrcA [Nitrospinae bacterium]|nr:heat-inducible transcription repressor HrcA [Nitrospinota bacterium]